MRVFIELIIRHYRAIFAYCFFNVGGITPVLLTGFIPVCGIWIRRVLKCQWIHSAIFLGSQTTFIIFNNCLVGKVFEKKLLFRCFFEICFAQFQQTVAVCQQGLNSCFHKYTVKSQSYMDKPNEEKARYKQRSTKRFLNYPKKKSWKSMSGKDFLKSICSHLPRRNWQKHRSKLKHMVRGRWVD